MPHKTFKKVSQETLKHQSQFKILLAFLLNLSFSVYEFIGGIFTNSTAIMSDAIHDLGDALSIGIAYFLEKKSTKRPDAKYTYGYIRYSLIGGMLTTLILLFGSSFVIYQAVIRLFNPAPINYNGMIIMAIIGVIINSIATYITRDKGSLNQKSVNLHMFEDVLGWVVVFVGAIIMRFTGITYLDPVLSILVAIFILWQAMINFIAILDVFLEKTPADVSLPEIQKYLLKIPEVKDIHHLHIWSLDGFQNYATLHVVTDHPTAELKQQIKAKLQKHQVTHTTIELETTTEHCADHDCAPKLASTASHHHHHNH